MKTIKVKPWGEGQGDFVLINEEDLNPEFHALLDAAGPEKTKALTVDDIRAALTAKNIEFKADAKKPELKALLDAVTLLEETKAALKAKNVEFDDNATQEELQALLDAAE